LLWSANALAILVFKAIGLVRYNTTLDESHHKTAQVSCGSPDLAYWYKSPSNPENKIPLVFIHGIGIGLVQYIHLVVALAFISRPLILIEVPYVSSQLIQTDCMTPDETFFAIRRILKTHGHPKDTFMGHSLGTMLCAAVCRGSSATSSDSIVAGLVLVDPVCFLTHHSIAHNFAYRIPATASQLVMDLFAAREIGTSWYIMRRFCWNQCVMFPIAWSRREQKPMLAQGRLSPVFPEKTRVFLSSNDTLLDMGKVATYLKTLVGLQEGQGEDGLVVMDSLDHAQFLLRPDWFQRIVQAAREC
jgi:pimeloyl-ACP methyl ester carboxylesterase